MVSAADPLGRNFGFLDRLNFFSDYKIFTGIKVTL
jgi:hypothetical protein